MAALQLVDDVLDPAKGSDQIRDAAQRDAEQEIAIGKLGVELAKLRDLAIKARKDSGIETIWLQCEEQYVGIDDANRSEFSDAGWAKPMTVDAPLTRLAPKESTKATLYVGQTRRYVDAGKAKVCEIAIPQDAKAFTFNPTPVPDMGDMQEDQRPAQDIVGQPMPGPDGAPVKVADLAKHALNKATKAANKAATRIYDWMVEYKHPAEMRKVVFDMARIGTGIIKGPIPEMNKASVVRKGKDETGRPTFGIEAVERVKPVARWVDPWLFYPAPGCGEDIHKGGYCFELAPMLVGELIDLGEQDGFDERAIDKVIHEGPGKCYTEGRGNQSKWHEDQYEAWHFHGYVPRAVLTGGAAAVGQLGPVSDARERVFAIATVVNDTVIRVTPSPMDSGKLPYRVGNWQRRPGSWTGVGVAEQGRTPQRLLNAALRGLVNNAGKSSGAQVVMDPSIVEPANRNAEIEGDKLWFIKHGVTTEDVRKVFASFNWPNTTPQLLTIIDLALKMFEEATSIPLISQGQSGKTTPDTFGGQQLQDNNANQLLRDVGFGLNDTITSPLVSDFYEWLLLDPDVPEDEKGDYQVDTSGAMALIEKALQDQTLAALLPVSKDPAYGLNPRECMEAFLRTKRLSPKELQNDEETQKRIDETPPPGPPAIEVAKIKADVDMKVAQSRDRLAAEKVRVDMDRDRAYQDSLNKRDADNAALRIEELKLKVRLAELEVQHAERISLQEAKVRLATETMGIQAQFALSGKDGKGPQVIEPPVEPLGRAPDGEAYAK